MAYLNIQKAEFNRATENLIEIAWKYESLKAEYDFLTNTDSMSWTATGKMEMAGATEIICRTR